MPKQESVDSSSDKYKYDAFLSFRGEDTRKTFTDHLYTALVNEGLIVFRDNEEIERGETIKSELEESIQESRSWIIVFSENYVFSSWCLDELVMILQCRNNSKRLLLPIFYHVDPSDIRKQSGSVSQAFYMHEEKFKREGDDTTRKELVDKIKRWRTALAQVADLAGMTFPHGTNGHEAEFIKDIVKRVSDKVAFNILSITPHLVGIKAMHILSIILQISYDSLEQDCDRDLFLDIACFFCGEAMSRVVMILDERKYQTRIAIEKLIDRCLLKIEFGNLTMHHLIQSMGREIIRQQSPKEPGERSRLWHYKDSLEVLKDKTGTRAIEGLALELNRANVCQVELRTSAFSRMHKLRLLKLDHVRLNGGYEDFPKKLEWLDWLECPLKALPEGFPSTSLVVIEMQRSKLQKLGQGSMLFKSLKFLDLSHSHDLVKSPNFAELIALEQLIVEDCVSLVEIDESIGMAAGLVLLNLKDCKLLKTLPKNIGMLKFLETLIISGCSNLDKLPAEMKNMESLKAFHADGIDFGSSSNTTMENKTWRDFIWGWVSKPRRAPQLTLTSLPFEGITKLSLVNCNLHDYDFPKALFFGHSVEYLDLSKNLIRFLPDCFKGLKRLKTLRTEKCKQLQALEGIPNMLKLISAGSCRLLEKIAFNGPFKFSSDNVNVFKCEKLIEMESLYKIVPIGEIDSKIINSCGIYDMEGMKNMQMRLETMYSGVRQGPIQVYLVIHNRTKDKIILYDPFCHGMAERGEDTTWLSHWTFGSHEMGPGDEVNISVWRVWTGYNYEPPKEIGVNVVYEEGPGVDEYVIPMEAEPNQHYGATQVYFLGNGDRARLIPSNLIPSYFMERIDEILTNCLITTLQ